MTIAQTIIDCIPGWLIERLYYSRLQSVYLNIYEYLSKGERASTYNVMGNVRMEIDLSKPAERAIPFGAYEPKVTKYILQIIQSNWVVFDIGAWIGYYTLLTAGRARRIIAIEPDVLNFKRLEHNIRLNNLHNVAAMNLAVGDRRYVGYLDSSQGSSTMATIESHQTGNQIQIELIDRIILTDLDLNYVHLMIMDIEGYEYNALVGMQESLSKGIIENLICEIHPALLRKRNIQEDDIMSLLKENNLNVTTLDYNQSRPYHIHACKT